MKTRPGLAGENRNTKRLALLSFETCADLSHPQTNLDSEMSRSVSFAVLALASVSYPIGDFNRLSDSCNKAMGQMAIGPAGNCLNTIGLINVLTTPSGQSWVGPFDNYLTEILSMTIASLKEGCATDLAEKGWSTDDLESVLDLVRLRESCSLSFSTGAGQNLCITTTLTEIQDMMGAPLNIGTLVAKTPQALGHSLDIPKNISCTPCTQGAYTIARPNLPSSDSVKAWDNFWINQCGEQFISGTLPASVAQTANGTTATTTPEPSSNNTPLRLNLPSLSAVSASLVVAVFSAVRVLQA
ncbi:hypothetical protein AG1IA_08925 [Rhizoctonia solani AG-1 IA]|uniref:Uncharacterized protein n=1 Tax=Thanatephorus cucumeris (strain AG1-IA) TaxID=983506 RepID=L8WFT4_THACA|nr:hypothetical protein AG1IA_08925 [Rhizoctonia solani AG-1 IA]